MPLILRASGQIGILTGGSALPAAPPPPRLAPLGRRAYMAALQRSDRLPTVFILNGPNLNLLGVREPATYGYDTLADVETRCLARAQALDLAIDLRQTNHQGQ